jgi:hypothetical protein
MGNAYRQLRDRQTALEAVVDRIAPPGEGTARRLVQIYNGGAMPTANDHYFAAHPVDVGAPEVEGGAPTFFVDLTKTLIVDVIGSTVPAVGDQLVATAVGGRWVAERGSGGGGCCPCTCPDGVAMPSSINLTLSGNGVSLGPFVLSPQGPCGYLFNGTVTVPATAVCPAIPNVPFTASVQYEVHGTLAGEWPNPTGWWLSVALGLNIGTVASGCPPALGAGLGWISTPNCAVLGTSLANALVLLSACPEVPFNVSGDLSHGAVSDAYFWWLIFGGQCAGGPLPSPIPFDITYTMNSPAGPPPKGVAGTMCQTFAVTACGHLVPGITITVMTAAGGTTLATGTTGSNGKVYLSWTGSPGPYWVEVTGESAPFGDPSATFILACAGTTGIALPPTTGICCDGCLFPESSLTLNYTSSGDSGSVPLVYVPGPTPSWVSDCVTGIMGCHGISHVIFTLFCNENSTLSVSFYNFFGLLGDGCEGAIEGGVGTIDPVMTCTGGELTMLEYGPSGSLGCVFDGFTVTNP